MSEIISVLMILATLAFLLEVALDRVKVVLPILGGSYKIKIGSQETKIAPMQFISLLCGIGLMFAINEPISLFGAVGYQVPSAVDHIINGILVSGGSNFVYDVVKRWEEKQSSKED